MVPWTLVLLVLPPPPGPPTRHTATAPGQDLATTDPTKPCSQADPHHPNSQHIRSTGTTTDGTRSPSHPRVRPLGRTLPPGTAPGSFHVSLIETAGGAAAAPAYKSWLEESRIA